MIHDGSSQNGEVAREERDSHDVCALSMPFALFPPVSSVSLETGIGDCSRSVHESRGLRWRER
jgi:hypothetical protein